MRSLFGVSFLLSALILTGALAGCRRAPEQATAPQGSPEQAKGLQEAMKQGRSRAKDAACLKNLHQLALAMAMYEQDYGDRFPKAANFAAVHKLLGPYDKGRSVPVCPATGKPYVFNVALSGAGRDALAGRGGTPMFRDAVAHADGRMSIAFVSGIAQRLPVSDPRAKGGTFR